MNSEIKSRVDKALNSSKSEAQLANLAEQLKQEGWNQLEVYDVFEDYMFLLREAGRDTEEDIVTNVLDYIYGYCRPEQRLFPHTLSNEEIKNYKEAKLLNQLQ